MKERLSGTDTTRILERFYSDCIAFWKREKESNYERYNFEIDIKKQALKDIAALTSNPYSPNGKLLSLAAKEQFIADKENDA